MKNRRWLRVVALIIVVVPLLAGGAVVALAKNAPFLPGQALFAAQNWAEEQWTAILPDATALANYRIDLAERRVNNLVARTSTPWELQSLAYVDSAVDRALLAVVAAPSSATEALHARLLSLAKSLQTALQDLTVVPAQNHEIYVNSLAKVEALKQAVSPVGAAVAPTPTPELSDLANLNPGFTPDVVPTPLIPVVLIDPHAVPFPPNATPGMHETFPLSGTHATTTCLNCHPAGDYVGTPKECVACHIKVKPAVHYPGVCSLCHSTVAWKPAFFDHRGVKECLTCHTKDEPANHFTGQCSRCHTTLAWLPANMDHTGLTDCISCHTKDKPANHFPGQCSGCHKTTAWKPAVVNHSAFSNLGCDVCHQPPANHFPYTCAACHHDTTNWKNVQVDHSLFGNTGCETCHARPANHFAGPCQACHHDTTNWKNVQFDHSFIGNADCSACHQPPANHFAGACKSCHHDTTNWKNAQFDHSLIGNADCSTCHQPPANHFGAPCSTCHHDTTNWRNATFNHTFPLNHGGANGNCSVCHPNGGTSWTCSACHSNADMDARHRSVNGYSHNCIACHPSGQGGGN